MDGQKNVNPTDIFRRKTAASPRFSIVIAALSTIIEWYDFTLYLYFATVLSDIFFGHNRFSLQLTLAGFAASSLLRPLGAVFFSRIGDRHGRRRMMLISMAMMTFAMTLTSLLPDCHHAGALAGVLLLLLRGIMAFSAGGEFPGVVTYLLESAPVAHRGVIASLASAASEVGGLLAAGVSAVVMAQLSPESLKEWGWRLPFIAGAVMAAILWWARTRIQETPDFLQTRGKPLPLRILFTRHRSAIIRSFAISALGSVTYYVGSTYLPTFLVSTGTMPVGPALEISVISAVSMVVITPLTGYLADRLGRKPVLLFLTLASVCLPVMLFILISKAHPCRTVMCAVLLSCLAGGISAIGTTSGAELFSASGRLGGLALGSTTASMLFGGLSPWLAAAVTPQGEGQWAPGMIIMIVAMCVLPVIAGLPETAPGKQPASGRLPLTD